MSLPLTQQANRWVGYLISYIAIASIYYSNTWDVRTPSFIISLQVSYALTGEIAADDLNLSFLPERDQVQASIRLHGRRRLSQCDGS